MTTESKKLLLDTFLKAHNVFDSFYGNLNADVPIDLLLKTNWDGYTSPIAGAFLWRDVPEGFQFWANLTDEWQEFFAAFND